MFPYLIENIELLAICKPILFWIVFSKTVSLSSGKSSAWAFLKSVSLSVSIYQINWNKKGPVSADIGYEHGSTYQKTVVKRYWV